MPLRWEKEGIDPIDELIQGHVDMSIFLLAGQLLRVRGGADDGCDRRHIRQRPQSCVAVQVHAIYVFSKA